MVVKPLQGEVVCPDMRGQLVGHGCKGNRTHHGDWFLPTQSIS